MYGIGNYLKEKNDITTVFAFFTEFEVHIQQF